MSKQLTNSLLLSLEKSFSRIAKHAAEKEKWLIVSIENQNTSISPLRDISLQNYLKIGFFSLVLSSDEPLGQWFCQKYNFSNFKGSVTSVLNPNTAEIISYIVVEDQPIHMLEWLQNFIHENGVFNELNSNKTSQSTNNNPIMITLVIKHPEIGRPEIVSILRGMPLELTFKDVSKRYNFIYTDYIYMYNGQILKDNDSPYNLGMKDNDCIEAISTINAKKTNQSKSTKKAQPKSRRRGWIPNLPTPTPTPTPTPAPNLPTPNLPTQAPTPNPNLSKNKTPDSPSNVLKQSNSSIDNGLQLISANESKDLSSSSEIPKVKVEKIYLALQDPDGKLINSHIRKDRRLKEWLGMRLRKSFNFNELSFFLNNMKTTVDIEKSPFELQLANHDTIVALNNGTDIKSDIKIESDQVRVQEQSPPMQPTKKNELNEIVISPNVEILMKMENVRNWKILMPENEMIEQAFIQYSKRIGEKKSNLIFVLMNQEEENGGDKVSGGDINGDKKENTFGNEDEGEVGIIIDPKRTPKELEMKPKNVIEVYRKIQEESTTTGVEVFAKDIPPRAKKSQVKKFFKKFGDIMKVYLLKDINFEHSSVAFATFYNDKDAYKCVQECQNMSKEILGHSIYVSLSTKEEPQKL